MRVLVHSRVFLPSFGGLEKMMDLVATELAAAGHEVTVVTMTPSDHEQHRPYRVVRCPSLARLAREALSADVCLVANITLRTSPLLLLLGRKVVTVHHGWYGPVDRFHLSTWLKRQLSWLTWNISCSNAVGNYIPARSIVIPNCYDSDLFHVRHGEPRSRDVVFVGRLVSDKGGNVLIDAIDRLHDAGLKVGLTIVGAGEERSRLEAQVHALRLDESVTFAGRLEGETLARAISRHRIMAIPSVCEEGFGIVALEGAACGCAIVGTDGGGLPEAIGPCGLTIPRGDATAMAEAIRKLLTDDTLRAQCIANAPQHLQRHTRSLIGHRYTEVLEQVARGQRLTGPVPSQG